MSKISSQEGPIPLRDEFEKLFANEVVPDQLDYISKLVEGLDPNEASDLIFRWMDSVEGEYKEERWRAFLSKVNPKDLTDMAKIKSGFVEHNEKNSMKQRKKWAEYGPWLLRYFKRNNQHSLTDGRHACAKHFGVSFDTIKRRTKGFKKLESRSSPITKYER